LERAEALQKETPDARLNAQISISPPDSTASVATSADSAAALEQAQQIFRAG